MSRVEAFQCDMCKKLAHVSTNIFSSIPQNWKQIANGAVHYCPECWDAIRQVKEGQEDD